MRVDDLTPEMSLLARVDAELEELRARLHRDAARRACLQDAATRLRLGTSAAEVAARLDR